MAYDAKVIGLHAKIKVRREAVVDGKKVYGLIDTTVGRMIFNRPIPQDLGFVDRSDPANRFKLEIDFLVGKKQLGKIIDKCIKIHGRRRRRTCSTPSRRRAISIPRRAPSPLLFAMRPSRKRRRN